MITTSAKACQGREVMDGWMDGWMGGWMDGWMDGWVDGPTSVLTIERQSYRTPLTTLPFLSIFEIFTSTLC